MRGMQVTDKWFGRLVQESLRKYSVVPVVVRELSATDQIEGHTLAAGTTVICHLKASLSIN